MLLVPAIGCSANVADDEDVAGAPEAATQGNVTVEQTVLLSSADPAEVVTRVSARFVQVTGGIDHEVANRVVGSPRDLPAEDSCVVHTPSGWEPLPPGAADGGIELLDVGEVMLHAGASTMPLAARAFPDVGDMVSGVVYTSRGGATELPVDVPYVVETSGSALADGFRVSVDAPIAPLGVQLGPYAIDSEELTFDAGQPLELSWQVDETATDRIYVDLVPLPDGGSTQALSTVRCAFVDDGAAQIPEQYTSFAEEPVAVEVAVHRLRRSAVPVPGVDEAVVEFDFAVLVRLPMAEPLELTSSIQ